MCPDLKIDLVAPPFAGHLFPLLDLASSLGKRGMTGLRILSTADAQAAVRTSGLAMVELLPGRSGNVRAIAETDRSVGGNPFRLYRQFRANVALMGELAEQLRELWRRDRPDLVIADFTVPVAGLVAMSLGIPWWTSSPSPCAIESRTGTPSYLGGWMPPEGWAGRLRDAAGRRSIRLFKKTVAALFARDLRRLGFGGVYRADGYEAIYSPDCILGLGMSEFEFPRDWPEAFRFVGPLTGSPPFPHAEPEFPDGKRAVLVTLGTHLPWARERVSRLIEDVAARMPDCVFHFAMGQAGAESREVRGNVHHHGYFPYDLYLGPRYAAAVTHGGSGITYSCIRAGVPALVWPQDFDQFDNAARVVGHGLGLRVRPTPERIVGDLRRLMIDAEIRSRLDEFRGLASRYDPPARVLELLATRGNSPGMRDDGRLPGTHQVRPGRGERSDSNGDHL